MLSLISLLYITIHSEEMIFCAWGSNYTQCKDFQTQTYSIDGSLSYLSYDFIADSRKIKDKELEKSIAHGRVEN